MTGNSTMKKDSREGISHDIMEYNILPRLPVKSMFRFKTVSKRWCNLIPNDSPFRSQQSQLFKPASGLLYWQSSMLIFLCTEGHSMSVPDPHLRFLGDYVSVLNSCNGLICGLHLKEDMWPEIYVCNPVTKDVISVPNPKGLHTVGLAFDPSPPNARYELICPYRELTDEGTLYRFDVFSSSTEVWRESKERIVVQEKLLVTGRSHFINGKLYFRANNYAIWFCPDEDSAGTEQLPVSDQMTNSTIGEYENRLRYAQVTRKEIEIWTLDGDTWERNHCIILESLDIFSRGRRNRRTLDYVVERSFERRRIKPLPLFLDDLVLFQMGTKAYRYRISTRELIEFPLPQTTRAEYSICLPYVNSLVEIPDLESVPNDENVGSNFGPEFVQ